MLKDRINELEKKQTRLRAIEYEITIGKSNKPIYPDAVEIRGPEDTPTQQEYEELLKKVGLTTPAFDVKAFLQKL